jgi:putative ABC transport system permease protein
MDTIAARLAVQYPDSDKTLGVQVRLLSEYISGEMHRPLMLLLSASCWYCSLLAPILQRCFSHAALRVRGTRGSGSHRRHSVRVIRQLLTESVLLAIIGAA